MPILIRDLVALSVLCLFVTAVHQIGSYSAALVLAFRTGAL